MSTHPSYRPDIDGLRALAVVPVLLYHASFPGFSGGFVGVDIFFVISGYLITKIIAGTIESEKFNIFGFYKRRLLRIAPAATVMVLATFVACWFLLPPEEMRLFGNSLLAAVASIANFYFWGSSGYFDADSASKPLLHLWSLSVEEQFYFIFPIALWLLYKGRKRIAQIAITLGFAASLIWAQYMVQTDTTGAFYSPLSRAWELLLGSILAMGMIPALPAKLTDWVAGVGVAMIFGSVIFFGHSTPIPGLSALVPCLGAAFVIWAGMASAHGVVSKIIGSRPLVLIGLISFSLYLWHWPILVLSSIYLDRPLTMSEAALALAVTVPISVGSYLFIERPFRASQDREKWMQSPSFWKASAAFALMVLVGGAGLATRTTAGFPVRASSEAILANNATIHSSPYTGKCDAAAGIMSAPQSCTYPTTAIKSENTIVVWGDSLADHIFGSVLSAAEGTGQASRLIFRSSCPPLLNVRPITPSKPMNTEPCVAFNNAAVDLIEKDFPKSVVVLAGNWSVWTQSGYLTGENDGDRDLGKSEELFRTSLTNTVKRLTDNGHKVLLINQAPTFREPARCAARSAILGRSTSGCYVSDRRDATKDLPFSDHVIAEIEASNPDVSAFNPASIICDVKTCMARVDGVTIYRDSGHFSYAGSQWFGKYIKLPATGI